MKRLSLFLLAFILVRSIVYAVTTTPSSEIIPVSFEASEDAKGYVIDILTSDGNIESVSVQTPCGSEKVFVFESLISGERVDVSCWSLKDKLN